MVYGLARKMSKKALALMALLVLLTMPQAGLSCRETPHYHPLTETQDPDASSVPIIMVSLRNGSRLNFTTVDDALRTIYGILGPENVSSINATTWDEYLLVLNGSSKNLTYYPATRLFFSKLTKQPKNYTGRIIPVRASDYLYDYYGSKYPRTLYGLVGTLSIREGIGNNTTTLNVLDMSYDFYMLLYANCSDNLTIRGIEAALSILSKYNDSLLPIIVDTSNMVNASEINISWGLIVRDNDTLINGRNSTFRWFVMDENFSVFVPLVIVLDSKGRIWWKNFGLANIEELGVYMEMYMDSGVRSLPVYPILDVVPRKPQAGLPCRVYIIVGYGFGNITSVLLSYRILNKNNDTIRYSPEPIEVPKDTLTYEISTLENESRWLVLNATIVSEYGIFRTPPHAYRVEYKKPPGRVIPLWVKRLAVIGVLMLVFLVVAIRIYRKYF